MKEALTNLIVRWLTPKFEWLGEINDIPDGASAAPVRGKSALIPVGNEDGAILLWTFDTDQDGRDCVLFARLTEDEAEAVYTADPYSTGMLEPVRRRMSNRFAAIGKRERDGSIHCRPFYVPKRGSERFMTDQMIRGASYAPMAVTESYATGMSRVLAHC
ncbi:hypothetical protein ACN95_14425 [Gordonia sihwensis]|uniref:hypothetical protein n=1 Tax=Gordonia sihwensis TaxID=173559 RepID=UPI001C92D4BD|nr:hypothetical protein [Gordonia sihwensis]MBY4571212.1 hypothetical protein [Gordonia sihwensis]